jgi:hypothetical protein
MKSVATTPRVIRGKGPPWRIKRLNYRNALPFLVEDFDGRCAYSLEHCHTAGMRCMEIDHFNPKLKRKHFQPYSNLFLASRHTNGSKSNHWPTAAEQKLGIRFLNCCQEQDYGVHIFEDPVTSQLVGVTPAGKYHIRYCDLNAPHLVLHRKRRTQMRNLLQKMAISLKTDSPFQLPDQYSTLQSIVDEMIPSIPPPP